jgi:hypothetical protein
VFSYGSKACLNFVWIKYTQRLNSSANEVTVMKWTAGLISGRGVWVILLATTSRTALSRLTQFLTIGYQGLCVRGFEVAQAIGDHWLLPISILVCKSLEVSVVFQYASIEVTPACNHYVATKLGGRNNLNECLVSTGVTEKRAIIKATIIS